MGHAEDLLVRGDSSQLSAHDLGDSATDPRVHFVEDESLPRSTHGGDGFESQEDARELPPGSDPREGASLLPGSGRG